MAHAVLNKSPMNTTAPIIPVPESGLPAPPVPPHHLTPVPPDPELLPPPEPNVYRRGPLLVIEDGAALPQTLCVRCGQHAVHSWTIHPRNPRKPLTWFGHCDGLEVGLCRKHREDHTVAVASTWSMLALGCLLAVVGVITVSVATILVGLFAMALSGIFRAGSPIALVKSDGTKRVLVGSKARYLNQFEEAPQPSDESIRASNLSLF